MKILSIGNSFSQDAQRYLYLLARNAGISLRAVNLFIGGCPLSRHYRNMLTGEDAYNLEVNGEYSGFRVSLDRALLTEDWDVVTIQQASHFSPKPETYAPYLPSLAEHIRRCAPRAKLLFHKTWAYEAGSDRLCNMMGYQTPDEMLSAITNAVESEAAPLCDGIIPAGDAMLAAANAGIRIHRDTFHASLGAGRLLLAELWLSLLSGKDLSDVPPPTLDGTDDPADVERVVKIARNVAAACPLGFTFS